MNTEPTYSLVSAPWIPLLNGDGERESMGLHRSLAEAHELEGLAGHSPLLNVAMIRLLLALVYRIYQPTSLRKWAALWKKGCFERGLLDDYFRRWEGRFDLFHQERPFYQGDDERFSDPKSIATLRLDCTSGNNSTLFDHHVDEHAPAFSPAQAAQALVVMQAFGLGGLSGLPQKFTDSLCARGILFVVKGRSLFETLMLNLIPIDQLDGSLSHSGVGLPHWERDAPFASRVQPDGYLDYLTWCPRKIRLYPERDQGEHGEVMVREMCMVPSLQMAKDAPLPDPMKHIVYDPKKGPRTLRFFEGKALWRDSSALFTLPTEDHPGGVRTLRWLSTLVVNGILSMEQTYHVDAMGMSSDKAKIFFFRHESMPLPLVYLNDERLVELLQEGLEKLKEASRKVWSALQTMAAFCIAPGHDQADGRQPSSVDVKAMVEHWAAERHFWSALELSFYRFLRGLPTRPTDVTKQWHHDIKVASRDTIELAGQRAGGGIRVLKAQNKALSVLNRALCQLFPTQEAA